MGKNDKPRIAQIFFNPDECAVMGMALAGFLEDQLKTQTGDLALMPWTPEARKAQKEMIAAARSAAAKLEKFAGVKCHLPEYKDGDQDEFLTKPS